MKTKTVYKFESQGDCFVIEYGDLTDYDDNVVGQGYSYGEVDMDWDDAKARCMDDIIDQMETMEKPFKKHYQALRKLLYMPPPVKEPVV